MAKKKIKWQAGDNFLVPLEDGSYSQGQVLTYEVQALNSAVCAFSGVRFESAPDHLDAIPEKDLIAVLFVTRDLLDSGRWHIVSNGPTAPWQKFLDIGELKSKGFIGVTIHGSGIVANFLSAFHKLLPWNCYRDPAYFDKLLISPDRRPADVVLKPGAPALDFC